jgi:hypothetical protein
MSIMETGPIVLMFFSQKIELHAILHFSFKKYFTASGVPVISAPRAIVFIIFLIMNLSETKCKGKKREIFHGPTPYWPTGPRI